MEQTRKYSKKREAILDVIKSTDSHPTAEWIYNKVKPLYPDLSLGTVYRNLNLFEQNGDVRCITTFNGKDRYDADLDSHSHFICTECNSILDISSPLSVQELLSQIKENNNLSPSSYSLTIYGSCKDCEKKTKN